MEKVEGFWQQRRKWSLLTVPTISVLTVIVLTLVVLLPQAKGLLDDMAEVETLRKNVKALTEKEVFLEGLDKAELSLRSRKLTSALPADEDLGYFMTGIRSMADRAGVAVTRVQLDEQVGLVGGDDEVFKAKEEEINMSIGLKGDIDSLTRFLLEVEESVPLVEVRGFSFGGGVDRGELTSAQMRLAFFYLPDPTEIGKVTRPVKSLSTKQEQVYETLAEFREPVTVELPRVPTGNAQFMF